MSKTLFKTTVFFSLIACLVNGSLSSANEKRERSLNVFSKGLDALLIDTQHVFVRPDSPTTSVYLDKIGALFISSISFTEGSNISIMIEDWTDWFDGNSSGSKKDEQPAEKDPSEKPDSKDSDGNKEITLKKFKNLEQRDKERILEMEKHLSAFKKELTTLMLDYGSVIKGLDSDEEIIVILMVKDKEFKTKYGAQELIMRIKYEELESIKDKDSNDSEAVKKIIFNI